MDLNGNNENIFIHDKFVYIKRNNKTFKYDNAFQLVECLDFTIDKQIVTNLYTFKQNAVHKFENLEKMVNNEILRTYSGQDIVDFHTFKDNFVYIDSKGELFKENEGSLGYTIKSPYKFYKTFIYFTKNRNLVKLDLVNLIQETVKKNVKPSLIEVFDDLIVLNINGAVQIISKDINLTSS
ncbi:hypothetical protein NBO_33g0016 [Nosema bombycis CQ1]|uniref:Uncharacterized protein n=1 Tax=Nosema bombycis (strain CQ1 / CVCC 102059) TaxID=578461 RepID=R0MJ18_NOSB1|nr:hypothetical protein NBO_33g0016 [Nosema bombycis CQ1]|eukprot:EOB14210.1 hypothetical protein NBO_33g0016 [Nosema bombycis CQ1]